MISGRGRNARYFIEKSIATKMIDKLRSTMSMYDAEELDRSVLGMSRTGMSRCLNLAVRL